MNSIQINEIKKRVEQIQNRMDKAEVQPWRAKKTKFGFDVLEPYGVMGRVDVLISSGLDGDTAVFLAQVPQDMRYLLQMLVYVLDYNKVGRSKKRRKKYA